MFPITDLSRADDIRRRRRRAFWLLVGIVVIPAFLFSGHGSGHHARSTDGGESSTDLDVDPSRRSVRSGSLPATDEMEAMLHRIPLIGGLGRTVEGAPLPDLRHDPAALSATGSSLLVSLPCASSITLVPQRDAAGRVSVSTRDARPPGESGVLLTGGAAMVLGGSCRHGRPDLVVQAPASMPLTLVQSGATDIRLGAFSGPVHLTQHGSGDAVIDASGPLDIVKSGEGDVSVDHLDGALQLSASGSGDVAIAHAQASHIQITGNGSGDFSVGEGRVDRLDATLHGSGDLTVEAEVGEASVLSSNESDIKLPHVTGHFSHTVLD